MARVAGAAGAARRSRDSPVAGRKSQSDIARGQQGCAVGNEQLFEKFRGAVANAQPDDLGWRAEQKRALEKVGVFGSDDEAVLLCMIPHLGVRFAFESTIADMLPLLVGIRGSAPKA